ncbi:hypothetical protein LIER_26840 [Lithospermum erythrorhizon]|uniref:Pentatricopeptide repeat-containing protein n=1 Tax=Lithospermum erythrorhizon TaxID=34254 RepID=A0AAV3RBE6_LITER
MSEYVKNGQLEQARHMFDKMRDRTFVSWNIMISAYSKLGFFNEALHLVWLMHHSSDVKFKEATFASGLSACAHSQEFIKGVQVHAMVLKFGFEVYHNVGSALLYFYACCYRIGEARMVFDLLHEENEVLWSVMLVAYVRCSLMSEAMNIFNEMPNRNVVVWTTIISGYSKSVGSCYEALELFKMMMRSEIHPNECTLDCVIRLCGKLHISRIGRNLHGLLVKLGYEFEQSVSSALICFYCEIENVDDAKMVYRGIVNPCLNNSNALLEGLLMKGRVEEAQLIFNGLLGRDSFSYNLMINWYAMNGQIEQAKDLYREMPAKNSVSVNTMISMYSRGRELDKALELFQDTKGERQLETWNSLISGYIQNDQHENAIELYTTMLKSSVSPTRSTFSALLRGCACLGCIRQGQILHSDLIKRAFESNVYVGTALVDMYSKCGSIADAQRSFAYISHSNVITWTALINGYGHHGMAYDAIILFKHMLEHQISPNAATFLALLSACNHAGLVNEGMRIFNLMKNLYGIPPDLRHYTCMVDLLAGSGHLEEAEELINNTPFVKDEILLIALLNACWFWMDVEAGKRVAEKIFSIYPNHPSACVIMSNMYAGVGKWGKNTKASSVVGEQKQKNPGFSWIELKTKVHAFTVDSNSHPYVDVIRSTCKHLNEI